ncbi:CerR family C-terminal domain-containing protein [Planctomycetes bacterium K23_9]|uniref:HTH-type transcriptional regulator TtgR n=1 Tax=Stieleria marina TaxID=1930275 RepID=A0A517NW64_9BACT|nr:HTH-type transcriptional regulator TtgR [Planctomycetes bacterium K23_9]
MFPKVSADQPVNDAINDSANDSLSNHAAPVITEKPVVTEEQDTRTRLLLTAGPIFAKSGFHRATIRDISQAANVNVASVAYHFGDKIGLYRAVIDRVRQSREERFPAPESDRSLEPQQALSHLIHTMLSRMIKGDQYGWESQLIMREMEEPTLAFREMVEEFFRPIYGHLKSTIKQLLGDDAPPHVVEQFSLSVVGQCVYYRIGRGVVEILVPDQMQRDHFGIDALCQHISATTIAAARDQEFQKLKDSVANDL